MIFAFLRQWPITTEFLKDVVVFFQYNMIEVAVANCCDVNVELIYAIQDYFVERVVNAWFSLKSAVI
jgi:hypothetical protein